MHGNLRARKAVHEIAHHDLDHLGSDPAVGVVVQDDACLLARLLDRLGEVRGDDDRNVRPAVVHRLPRGSLFAGHLWLQKLRKRGLRQVLGQQLPGFQRTVGAGWSRLTIRTVAFGSVTPPVRVIIPPKAR